MSHQMDGTQQRSTSKRMRKSEFSYSGEHADDRKLYVSDGDKEFFSLLHPNRYHILPGPWVCALLGRPYYRSNDHRLARLARAPHNFLIRHKQDRRISKDSAYQRAPNADKLMNDEAAYKKDPLAHRILEDIVQASIELGVLGREDLRLRRTDIERFEELVPDGNVYTILDRTHHLNYVKEIQRSRNNTKNRVRFKHYDTLSKNKNTYGLQNLVVLFIAKSDEEMRELMKLCEQEIGAPKYIGFSVSGDPWNDPQFPKPSGDYLEHPWQRVGHPPVFLSKLWEA